MRFVVLLSLHLLTLPICFAQQPFPIRQISLYKNGMAHIVRSGELNRPTSIPFHREDMNDVLKSFAAWNPQTGSLYPTGYTAGTPIEDVLSRLPYQLEDRGSGLVQLLDQLRGAPVTLQKGSSRKSGRLVSVSPQKLVQESGKAEEYRVTILAGSNQLFSYRLSEIDALTIDDPRVSTDLETYLETLHQNAAGVVAQVTIYPIPEPGPIRIAYVQEFPVWKSSYRLNLSDEEKATIQGWAQIDNPTGESWNSIDLTLISGDPASFVTDLYLPRYVERPEIPLPESGSVAPRRHEAALEEGFAGRTPNSVAGTVTDSTGAAIPGVEVTVRNLVTGLEQYAMTDNEGRFEVTHLRPGNLQVTASMTGFRTYTARTKLLPGASVRMNIVLEIGDIAELITVGGPGQEGETEGFQVVAAETGRVRDLWTHHFPFPVTLSPQQSARIPYLNEEITVQPVTLVNRWENRGYLALELQNDTKIPLGAGPITLFQSGRYAGEAMIDFINRKERRLISYGVDHEVQVSAESENSPERVARVRIFAGVMTFQKETIQTTTYQIKSRAEVGKPILIEHPKRSSELLGIEPDEVTPHLYRFRVELAAGQELRIPVKEVLHRETRVDVGELSTRSLELQLAGRRFPEEVLSKLREIFALQASLDQLRSEKERLQENVKSISEDQQRIRENLKALGQSTEERSLRQLYLKDMTQQETELKKLDEQTRSVADRISSGKAQLAKQIAAFEWEGDVL